MTRSLTQKNIGATLSALAASLWLGAAPDQGLAAGEPAASQAWPKAPGAVFALGNAHFATPRVARDAKGR
ncbi:MAG: hypothetical protein WCK89_19095, partial [bacterium]